jgi:hypothetical protein
MKAVVQNAYCSPDELDVADVDRPVIGAEVTGAAIRHLREGHPGGKVVITVGAAR